MGLFVLNGGVHGENDQSSNLSIAALPIRSIAYLFFPLFYCTTALIFLEYYF